MLIISHFFKKLKLCQELPPTNSFNKHVLSSYVDSVPIMAIGNKSTKKTESLSSRSLWL